MAPRIIVATRPVAAPPDAIVIDFANKAFWRNGHMIFRKNNVSSTPVKFRILAALLVASPRPVSFNDLMEFVYGDTEDGGPLTARGCLKTHLSLTRSFIHSLGYVVVSKWGWGVQLLPAQIEVRKAA